MHMVHVEESYVNYDGSIDWTSAKKDASGLAVLGVFFQVDEGAKVSNTFNKY